MNPPDASAYPHSPFCDGKSTAPILSRRAALRGAGAMVLAGAAGCAQVASAGTGGRPPAGWLLGRPFLEYPTLPYALGGSRLACTVIREGRRGAFQELVDDTLNAATRKGRFALSPMFPGLGMMGVFHFDRVQSLAPGSWGYMRYYEAALSLILVDRSSSSTRARGSLYIFNPVMMLDDFYTLIAGREIYGFPKMLGKFNASGLPEDGHAAAHPLRRVEAEVSVQGFTANSPDERVGWRDALKLTVVPRGLPFRPPSGQSVGDFLGGLSLAAPGPDRSLTQAFLGGSIKGVFLKQFPSCGNVSKTCYRSVTKAPYGIKSLKQIRFGQGSVTFHNPASYPLATALGYEPDASGKSPEIKGFGFVADADWELGGGNEA